MLKLLTAAAKPAASSLSSRAAEASTTTTDRLLLHLYNMTDLPTCQIGIHGPILAFINMLCLKMSFAYFVIYVIL